MDLSLNEFAGAIPSPIFDLAAVQSVAPNGNISMEPFQKTWGMPILWRASFYKTTL
jgi:hypothetical protein